MIYEKEPIEVEYLYRMNEIKVNGFSRYNRRTQEIMKRNLKDAILWRKKNNIDSNILILGEKGSGKTNVAIHLKNYLMEIYDIDKWFLEIGEGLDFATKTLLDKYGKNSIIVVDEAQESFNAPSNANIIRLFSRALDSLRKFNIHFIFTTPSIKRINDNILQQLDFLITCLWRDAERKIVDCIIEYKAMDNKGTIEEFIEHSRVVFPYVSKREFENYNSRVMKWGFSEERDYHSERKMNQRIMAERKEHERKMKLVILAEKLIRKHKIKLEKKDANTLSKKEKVAIELFNNGANVNFIQDILKVGRGKARSFEYAYLKQKKTHESNNML